MTRGAAATILLQAAGLTPNGPPPFDDIAGSTHEASITALSEAGIVDGFGDGTFRADQTVSRGQFASLVARALPMFGDLAE